MVFSGVYPADRRRILQDLRDALEKLKLNDASMSYDAGNLASRSASASAAAFWDCCTWRSSTSGSEREYNLSI